MLTMIYHIETDEAKAEKIAEKERLNELAKASRPVVVVNVDVGFSTDTCKCP